MLDEQAPHAFLPGEAEGVPLRVARDALQAPAHQRGAARIAGDLLQVCGHLDRTALAVDPGKAHLAPRERSAEEQALAAPEASGEPRESAVLGGARDEARHGGDDAGDAGVARLAHLDDDLPAPGERV